MSSISFIGHILPDLFKKFNNCNSNYQNTVYLIGCNQWKQYTGSSKTKFHYRNKNYKNTHFKFKNKKQVPKEALNNFPQALLPR